MFNAGSDFTINYQKLITAKEYLLVTRKLATTLTLQPYTTVKQFLNSISSEELTELLEMSVADDDEDDDPLDDISETERYMGDLILIAEMLATSEGLDISDSYDMVQNRVSQLVAFLAVESLARKGLVKSYPENMSFGEDMSTKIIAERLEDE